MNNIPSNHSFSAPDSGNQGDQQLETMRLPLFPLNTVLFPGMLLPLNIFEPRYLEMIKHCIENETPFGVVLIRDGEEVGGEALPHQIGTAARIKKVKHQHDGRMSVVAVGTRRFRVETFDYSRAYLTAHASLMPVVNDQPGLAEDLMRAIQPGIVEYVDLIAKASKVKVRMENFPEDPKSTAYLIAGALQVDNAEKQAILEMPSIPAMLVRERHLLSRETLLMRHMVDTHASIMSMGAGPTGYLFPN